MSPEKYTKDSEKPRATNVTHAAVHPQTDIDSPKLKPEFPSPKPESSGIRRTTLTKLELRQVLRSLEVVTGSTEIMQMGATTVTCGAGLPSPDKGQLQGACCAPARV
jgi:hypothetical protein